MAENLKKWFEIDAALQNKWEYYKLIFKNEHKWFLKQINKFDPLIFTIINTYECFCKRIPQIFCKYKKVSYLIKSVGKY